MNATTAAYPYPTMRRPDRMARRYGAKKQKIGILTTFFVIQVAAKDDISRAVIFETPPCFFKRDRV